MDALVNQRVFISKSSTFLIGEVERRREARLKGATQVKTSVAVLRCRPIVGATRLLSFNKAVVHDTFTTTVPTL